MRSLIARVRAACGGPAADSVDLTTSVEPTLFLLGGTRAWRQRLVETFTYQDAAHVGVTSSYQVELTPDFLDRFVPPGARHVNVLVPLTTRPKRALLGFDVEVADGKAGFVLPRRAGADIQTTHLLQLRDSSPADRRRLSGFTPELLRAICSFIQGTWKEFEARSTDDVAALSGYLSDGLGLEIPRECISRWMPDVTQAGELVRAALDEPPAPVSASENVLLALPAMGQVPATIDDVEALVDGYIEAVRAAARAGDDDLLGVLGEYGRRWEVFVEAELATDRPTMIRLSEDRGTGLGPGGEVVADVALGDAGSVHFEARVTDPNVALGKSFTVMDLSGETVGVPLIESARITDESLSLYSSATDRPYYVRVGFTLRPSAYLVWMANGVLAVMLSAIAAAALLDGSDLAARLGLVLLPSTFAAAFVLTREETPLAARTLSGHRRRIGKAVGVLWVVALVRLLATGTLVPDAVRAIERIAEWLP